MVDTLTTELNLILYFDLLVVIARRHGFLGELCPGTTTCTCICSVRHEGKWFG